MTPDYELQQTIANTTKLLAEAAKLQAEERKLNIDRWFAPVIVVFGGAGSLVGAAAAVYRLIHG